MKRLSSLMTASDQAYLTIKEMISQYQLIPGQKISYRSLVDKLKMSKTPIINALNRLEKEEFVVSHPNRGFFVKEVQIEEVTELFRIREALERIAVEDSIKKLNPNGLKYFQSAMIAHQKHDPQTPSRHRLALDATFHLKIAEMTGNRNLVRLLRYVFELIYLRHRVEGVSSHRMFHAAEEHLGIFKAIKNKDINKAKNLMRAHIRAGLIATTQRIKMASSIIHF